MLRTGGGDTRPRERQPHLQEHKAERPDPLQNYLRRAAAPGGPQSTGELTAPGKGKKNAPLGRGRWSMAEESPTLPLDQGLRVSRAQGNTPSSLMTTRKRQYTASKSIYWGRAAQRDTPDSDLQLHRSPEQILGQRQPRNKVELQELKVTVMTASPKSHSHPGQRDPALHTADGQKRGTTSSTTALGLSRRSNTAVR